jgi:hypothetical protein
MLFVLNSNLYPDFIYCKYLTTNTFNNNSSRLLTKLIPELAGVNPGNDPGVIENNDVQIRVEKDQYVIATYLQRCYVGKVLNVDPDDGEIEISFMENKKNKFQWPMHGDVLWIPSKDVLSIVAEPFLSGRSGRMLQLRTEDKDIFDKFLS